MRTKFAQLDFETECMWDCINGKGFLIKEPPFSDADKSIRNMDGPRSPRYGTSWSDVDAFNDRYHCNCGYLVGATFEGEICPRCNTEVEYTEVDPKITGWLNFWPYHVINPLQYHRLQSALSKKVLEGIISNDNIITPEGHIRSHTDDIEVKKTMMKYFNIGIRAFYENYEEIMTYYMGKRKQKADLIERLIQDKHLVWTSKIPVFSTILRPQSITAELKCGSYFS